MELFRLLGRIVIDSGNSNEQIDETSNRTRTLSERLESAGDTLKSVGSKMVNFGDKVTNLGKKFAPISGAVTAIGVASIKTAADFESAMSQVAATMGMTSEEINNGSEDFARLEQAARDMGKATKYSATDAANALNYLALAGYSVDESIATLPTVLNLAAAGGIDLAYASDMVTDAMSALGDKAGTAEEFVDKMAKTSQKSNTSVAQLGEAILTVGGTAKVLAGGTTELNAALGILADNGIKGAEGGTALRNVIMSLTAPTDDAAELMASLGVNVYDAQGKMRPLNRTLKDLNNALSTMNDQERSNVLSTIFDARVLKSAEALLGNCGDRFNELSGYINDSEGAAKAMADTMQNNLNGKITTLKSAISEAAISIGQIFIPTIDKIVEVIQKWTDKFNSLDNRSKKIIATIGAVIAAIAPVLLVVGKVISSIGLFSIGLGSAVKALAAFKAALSISKIIQGVTTAVTGLNAVLAANPILLVVAAIAALVIALTALGVAIYKNWDSIKAWCADIGKKVKDTFVNLGNHVKDAAVSVKKSIDENFPAAGKAIDKTMEAASKTVSEKLSNIKKAFDDNGGGIKGTVAAAFEAVKGYHTAGFTFIDNLTGNKLSGLATSFRDKFTEIKNNVSSKLENLKSDFGTKLEEITNNGRNLLNTLGNSFSSTFENAKGVVQKAIDKIKGFMDFEWKLPDIKLPHFKITPKDWKFSDLLEGETPYLSIEWYKNGGIMNKPTMFGFNPASGSAMVGGEAGAEAIAPIDKLQQYVSDAVAANNAIIADAFNDGVVRIIDFLQRNNNNTNMRVVLDSGTLVGELAPALDSKLGNMVNKRNRGN